MVVAVREGEEKGGRNKKELSERRLYANRDRRLTMETRLTGYLDSNNRVVEKTSSRLTLGAQARWIREGVVEKRGPWMKEEEENRRQRLKPRRPGNHHTLTP